MEEEKEGEREREFIKRPRAYHASRDRYRRQRWDRRNGHPAAEFRRLNPRVPGQIPFFSRGMSRTWVVEGCRRDRRRNGEKGGREGRGVIVLQNNLNFNYFGELQKRRCDSLTVCHRKINWLPSLPPRPRSKLSYDPLSPFLSSPPPPPPLPFHPPPPFLRHHRPHHHHRHPLVDQLLGAKRGGDRTVFPGVPSVIPMQLAAELSVTFRAAADHPRIRPDISEYPRVQFNRLVKFDRDEQNRWKRETSSLSSYTPIQDIADGKIDIVRV